MEKKCIYLDQWGNYFIICISVLMRILIIYCVVYLYALTNTYKIQESKWTVQLSNGRKTTEYTADSLESHIHCL